MDADARWCTQNVPELFVCMGIQCPRNVMELFRTVAHDKFV